MLEHLRSGIALLAVMTLLCGVVYPLTVTAAGLALFPGKAGGSLVHDATGAVIGSALIGQAWTSDRYVHGRPSATGTPYDASASSGSNLGPTNPALKAAIDARSAALLAENPGGGAVPADLLTTSASGLDPDITVDAANWQAPRVAKARGIPEEAVRALIVAHTSHGDLGLIPRVNVLALNLALDGR